MKTPTSTRLHPILSYRLLCGDRDDTLTKPPLEATFRVLPSAGGAAQPHRRPRARRRVTRWGAVPRAGENPAEERTSRGRGLPKPAPEEDMNNTWLGHSDRRKPAGIQRVSGAVCPQHVRRSRASRWPLSTRRRATWHPGFPTSRTTSRTKTHIYSGRIKWYQNAGSSAVATVGSGGQPRPWGAAILFHRRWGAGGNGNTYRPGHGRLGIVRAWKAIST